MTEETTPVAPTTIFSSDLLTPEEERELLADFWERKSELVRVLIRHFSRLRQHRPALEPWPMAQFIRDHCDNDARDASSQSAACTIATSTSSIAWPRPTSAWPPTSPSASAITPSATPTCCRKPSAA